ncbi:FecR family protein [Mangrovibacterium diazotrophicum]|uniref:FecR family protein n=1 Tax=Mangrovibacterium diazotrophicum TaxID=1261403 RepID=A0A419W2I7_9BACT|nr:FecR domain-containing protein [Mangrovibacterium diazotrophicum]RKD89683.1 FecR family protein [Mangrovibacterium diazotrophicum]
MRKVEEDILNNPLFFKWVYHPNEETEHWWKEYIQKHPEFESELEQVKKQLLKIQYEQEVMGEREKKALARKIMEQTINRHRTARILRLKSLTKYAAISFLFFCLGGTLVYFFLEQEKPYQILANSEDYINIKGPSLILDNKEIVALEDEESNINYLDKGKVIVNGKSVLKKDSLTKSGNELNQLLIPYGNRSKIVLSDSTVIWLNAGSRLIYPTTFKGEKREVFLFGEAFFQVSKDKEHPFIISTNDLSIKVLGTQFNVSAYPEDQVVQTVLTEGRVSIKKNKAGLFEKEVVLNPGQMASFNKESSETKVVDVDPVYYVIWKDGTLKFTNEDLSRVIKKLERFYNVSFSFRNALDGSIQISGKLDLNGNLDEVVKYVEKAADVKITSIKGTTRYYIN